MGYLGIMLGRGIIFLLDGALGENLIMMGRIDFFKKMVGMALCFCRMNVFL